MGEAGNRGAFLDRDGTIIEDRDYLADPAGVQLLPGSAEAIRRLTDAGFKVVIVTNQSGIGRGFFSEADYRVVHDRMVALLADEGAEVLDTLHCPHGPDEDPPCDCRKPRPGLFLQAASRHDIDLGRSVYIGDRVRDLETGLAMGGRGFLIHSSDNAEAEERPGMERVESLSAAVTQVLKSPEKH